MSEHLFSLRAAQPADSAGIASFMAEFDGDLTTHFLIDPYTAIVSGSDEPTRIVVAECEGYAGFVGMGTVRFGRMQYNGQVLPFAGLDGLKVKAPLRGQGLGRKLAEWRVEQARQAYGEECVLLTGLLRSNRRFSSRHVHSQPSPYARSSQATATSLPHNKTAFTKTIICINQLTLP